MSQLLARIVPEARKEDLKTPRFTKTQLEAMMKMATTPKDKELIKAAALSGLSNRKVIMHLRAHGLLFQLVVL